MSSFGLLLVDGVFIDKELLTNKIGSQKVSHILNALTIHDYNPITKKRSKRKLWCYKAINNKQYIKIPRYAGVCLYNNKTLDNLSNVLKPGIDIQFKNCKIILHDYQQIILSRLEQSLETNQGTTILKLKAGRGKTFISMLLIKKINKKTLVIVPNKLLAEQWIEELEKNFPDNIIGRYYTGNHIDGDIVVMIVKSATLISFNWTKKNGPKYDGRFATSSCPRDYFEDFGLTIFDEAHLYTSVIYSKTFTNISTKYMVGLTATPEQPGVYEKVIVENIGPILDAELMKEVISDDIEFKGHVDIIRYNGPDEYTNICVNPYTGFTDVDKMVKQFINDPYRTKLIIDKLKQLHDDNKNIFIFVNNRLHIGVLFEAMIKYNLIPQTPELKSKVRDSILERCSSKITFKSDQVQSLMGMDKKDEINSAKHGASIIITTYQYSSVGMSFPKMDSLIFASPRRSNMKQIIPRIMRLGGDMSKTRHIIDVVDNRTSLKNQLNERKKAYNYFKFTTKETKVLFSDITIE